MIRHPFSREFWALVAGGLRRGRQDVYETTRQSILSPEARTGALVFAFLWLLGRWHGRPPEPALDAEIWLMARRWHGFFYGGIQFLALCLHMLLGVFWGFLAQNVLDLRAAWRWSGPRPTLGRRVFTAAGMVLLLHGACLVLDMGARPGLYRALLVPVGPLRLLFVLSTESPAWLRRGIPILLFAPLVLAALANLARRLVLWFLGFGQATRMAAGVLTLFILLSSAGVWGVLRFQAQRNKGPNLVLLIVDGLRSGSLTSPVAGQVGGLHDLAGRGRAYVRGVPPTDDPQGALASFFFGAPPFVHGFRGPYPPQSIVQSAPPSLAAVLRARGYRTAVLTDAGGDFFTRLSPDWDRCLAPPDTMRRRLARGILERSLHLLPYISGPLGRAGLPVLRGSAALSDPAVLAKEAANELRRMRFRSKFFLTVHWSGLAARGPDVGSLRQTYDAGLPAISAAVARVVRAVEKNRLADQTWVVLWSPRGAPWSAEDLQAAERLDGPVFFDAPFLLVAPHLRGGASRSANPLRVQDMAPGILSAMGLAVPARPANAEAPAPWGSPVILYAESAAPAAFAPPSGTLIEDRLAPGRLTLDPAYLDRWLVGKRRMVQSGADRLVYTPGADGVQFEFYRLNANPAMNLAAGKVWAAHLREVKELFYRYLAGEPGWRPQNEYWLPEAFLREEPYHD